MAPDDPTFPWSTNAFVKVVALNGTLWLPGGPIPQTLHNQGFQVGCYGYLLDELVKLSERFKIPDVELYVYGGDLPIVHGPSSNGFLPPVLGPSSAKAAMDIAIPDCYQTGPVMKFEPDWLE